MGYYEGRKQWGNRDTKINQQGAITWPEPSMSGIKTVRFVAPDLGKFTGNFSTDVPPSAGWGMHLLKLNYGNLFSGYQNDGRCAQPSIIIYNVTYYETTSPEQEGRVEEADIIITTKKSWIKYTMAATNLKAHLCSGHRHKIISIKRQRQSGAFQF